MTKKQYRTPKVSVGTVKKSIAALASRWLLRKVRQRPVGSAGLGARRTHRETVGSDRSKPSLALESHFQYSRKPARCQPTTVLGVTWMRGSFHLSQSLRNTTQNSLCDAVSRRRGRWA